ncbi:high affinity immunoglobulin epsilon receptor subunit gamma-like, partial [Melanotaenia boesemani]|uniref:high affinity immunoglobulin epsilon receptor subunit gamma-like n=1 Tax=Melanotaenia boesemani TaxID=1250792 RepID=UPI001C0459C7
QSTRVRQSRSFIFSAEAIGEMYICYILDGILILYGIILTILYCRLRMHSSNSSGNNQEKQPAAGGIYAGLTSPSNDTYETIRDKRPMV